MGKGTCRRAGSGRSSECSICPIRPCADRLDAAEATPKSILIDFDDTFAEFAPEDRDVAAAVLNDVEYDDLCADVDPSGEFTITLAGRKFQCKLTFNESTQRYTVTSDELDKEVSIKSSDPDFTDTPVTTYINRGRHSGSSSKRLA